MEELGSSSCRHTLRGLHFQRRHSQDKLVRVLSGEVYDVVVDLRPNSETFGRWQSFRLSAENRKMLYVPKQFAHGFLVLSDEAVLHYLCGARYDPESEDGIIWNDPDLAIDWLKVQATQSMAAGAGSQLFHWCKCYPVRGKDLLRKGLCKIAALIRREKRCDLHKAIYTGAVKSKLHDGTPFLQAWSLRKQVHRVCSDMQRKMQ